MSLSDRYKKASLIPLALMITSCVSYTPVQCNNVHKPAAIRPQVYISITPDSIKLDDGGEELIREYAKARESIAIMCGE